MPVPGLDPASFFCVKDGSFLFQTLIFILFEIIAALGMFAFSFFGKLSFSSLWHLFGVRLFVSFDFVSPFLPAFPLLVGSFVIRRNKNAHSIGRGCEVVGVGMIVPGDLTII